MPFGRYFWSFISFSSKVSTLGLDSKEGISCDHKPLQNLLPGRIDPAAVLTGQLEFMAAPIAESFVRRVLVLAHRAFHVQRPPSMQHYEEKKEGYRKVTKAKKL